MTTPGNERPRSYGCTFGCGNPYDVLLVSVQDGTTEFLCVPCLLRLTADMMTAMLEPDSINVQAKVSKAGEVTQAPMNGYGAKRGRRNAPATSDDPDLFDAFDSRIDASELPADFR